LYFDDKLSITFYYGSLLQFASVIKSYIALYIYLEYYINLYMSYI